MNDRVLSIFAFLVLAWFLAVVVWYVPRLDLAAVILLTLVLVFGDFFLGWGQGGNA